MIERTSEAIDIGANIGTCRVERLLRRHVLGRAQHRAARAQAVSLLFARGLGESEVENLDL